MATNDYHFITHWRVKSTLAEINEILGNANDLPRWWPSVYLDIKQLATGNEQGIGRVISLFTKGWLPYTLQWQFRVTENRYPYGFTIEAWGDFVGRGIWTFEQQDDDVIITYDWKIVAEKAILRTFSFIMKPFFAANHEWAMRMGLISLERELRYRHAQTEAERAAIPPPPAPTFAGLIPKLQAPTVILGANKA